MRTRILATLAALSILSLGLQAAGGMKFARLSVSDAERALNNVSEFTSPAAMWIWSDKYVYTPGQQVTVRWTIKPNGDLYPYTLVAYRINNQTGVKTYLPSGSATASDIFGNSIDQGFDIVRLPAGEKQVLGNATVPNELGMHTLVLQARDFTGTRVVKSAYFKIGVVEGFEELVGDVTSDRTLVNTKAYNLSGVLLVRDGATLTIEPGTFVIGQPGSQPPSSIVVGNDGRIMAAGTRARPIIMTSSLPFGQRRGGDWGGLVMLGRAPSNWPNGVGNIEGLPPDPDTEYGGDDPAHDCGTLSYVRLEFSGAELRPNDEINSFTWGGCGTQTVAHHLQAHYGLDDSFEWFSGNNDGKYLVSTYPRDDHFDGQIGWTGRVQFGLGLTNLDNSNRGYEMDNNENDFGAVPLNKPTFYNMTFVGAGNQFDQGVDEGSVAGIYLRRGAAGTFNNQLIYNWVDHGIRLQDDATLANLDSGDLTMNGILMWMNGIASGAANTLEGNVHEETVPFITGQRGTALNVTIADPMLVNPLEYSAPDFRPALGSPVYRANWVQPPDDGFFDQSANFIGAFGEIDWTEEWTMFIQEQDMTP
ncbi:MAG: hypothetical protein WD733_05870 [Bryobacterales bacterium]